MKKNISIIGVPMHLGQPLPGTDLGPDAIRHAGAVQKLKRLQHDVEDLGNIKIEFVSGEEQREENLLNLQDIIDSSTTLAKKTDDVLTAKRFPLLFGGDHSMAIGSLAGISKHYENLGVIWYDAHGDLNDSRTSPSGNIHGMPLAVSLGIGHKELTSIHGDQPKVKPENLVIIGARDLDPGEKELIRERGIRVYSMREVDELGMNAVIQKTIEYLKERTDGIHLSLDLDGLDPTETPGVGTPVYGGPSYRETRHAMELLHDADVITSAEFVEVNPLLDDKNKTGIVAANLISALFGETLK
ncbi:arginase [Virgibacillus necropolis]|uniref:Arginase n=1 Tax=Virgibacillus necropolis TaxID=163877 RepID=A0A221M7L5_9BACI|nr:arginase [Virgibacillus necropolis]ASN03633.1 arginase [Virgibacillus necropolis]